MLNSLRSFLARVWCAGIGWLVGFAIALLFAYLVHTYPQFILRYTNFDPNKVTFKFSLLFWPLFAAWLSLFLSYVIFEFIPSATIFVVISLVINTWYREQLPEGGKVILGVMGICVLGCFAVYWLILKKNYNKQIRANLLASEEPFLNEAANFDIISDLIALIKTPPLWRVFRDREELIKKYLRTYSQCVLPALYKKIEEETRESLGDANEMTYVKQRDSKLQEYKEKYINCVDKMPFYLNNTLTFFSTLILAFLGIICMICAGLVGKV